MKFKLIWLLIPVLAIIALAFLIPGEESEGEKIIIKPSYGEFKSTVTTTGELQAENSIEIRGPMNARIAGIWQMKIEKLVPEGTIIKAGDVVAELDKSEITNKINEAQLNVEKFESQYLQAKLDSTLELSNARDEIENIKYAMEEKKLLMEQSAFEPPAIIRQAEINYEKEQRSYEQKTQNYKTKVKQSIAKLREVSTELSKEKQKLEMYLNILKEFTIKASSPGMVIYDKEWNGKKKTVGSTVSSWDPVVATLPDLTSMKSVTYINEVDIQKIHSGQKVKIGLDADPDKKLTGEVTMVANIGEQLRNSDSKVFEVEIKVNEKDTTLLPSMTTSNEILVATVKDKLFIPIEAVHSEIIKGKKEEEKVTFVYKRNGSGIIKQEVKLGLMNENEVIVEKGLNKDEEIHLSTPDSFNELELARLKLNSKEDKKPDA